MQQRITMEGGGFLCVRQENASVWLEAHRNWDQQGLYKVWLSGQSGERMLIGTLIPEGGELRLLRRLSVNELERSGCWPIAAAQAVVAFRFGERREWYREQNPGQWVSDPLLRSQLKGNALCRRMRESRQLAFPFHMDRRVPLETLICLAQPECIGGQWHLVWEFDALGAPVVPKKQTDKIAAQ